MAGVCRSLLGYKYIYTPIVIRDLAIGISQAICATTLMRLGKSYEIRVDELSQNCFFYQ